jgi:sec-independent protein translocase protein TatC
MYLKKYINEAKKRILLLIIHFIVFFLTSFIYKEFLLFIFIKPYIFSNINSTQYFITTGITELFYAYIKIIIYINIIFSTFLTFYHFILFIKPGFYYSEILKINKLKKLLVVITIVYIIFIYKIVFFEFLKFFYCKLINLTQLNVYLEPKLSEYLKLFIQISNISFILAVISTFFIFYLLLFKTPWKEIKRKKKVILYTIFVLTALITPPDLFNQIYLGIFFLFFSETIILFSLYYKSFLIKQPIKIKKNCTK